jgi:hypothetical protein
MIKTQMLSIYLVIYLIGVTHFFMHKGWLSNTFKIKNHLERLDQKRDTIC